MSEQTPFIQLIDAFSNAKGLSREVVLEALSAAHAKIIAKQFQDENPKIEVELDVTTGGYLCYRIWEVVADDYTISEEETGRCLALTAALELSPEAQVGDHLRVEIPGQTGRIEAHEFAQLLRRIVDDAVRLNLAKKYHVGQILTGQVKHTTRDRIVLDIAEYVDASLARDQMLPREIFRVGDKVRCCISEINAEGRGALLRVSRASKEMLVELFKIEVPELNDGSLEIRGVARDPGVRAKIAVKAIDTRIDPVGACVGIRGARVQAITQELNGERIDICLWDEDLANMIARALAPAEIESVAINEVDQTIDVVAAPEQQSLAIGKNGQNVRLAGEMLGWNINVMSEEQAEEKNASEDSVIIQRLVESLEIDSDLAEILLREGYTSIEAIAYTDPSELNEVEEFDPSIVEELQDRARTGLLMLKMQSDALAVKPSEDLLSLPNMSQQIAVLLAENNICTKEQLAEMDIDELTGLVSISEKEASALIMAARADWFSDEE